MVNDWMSGYLATRVSRGFKRLRLNKCRSRNSNSADYPSHYIARVHSLSLLFKFTYEDGTDKEFRNVVIQPKTYTGGKPKNQEISFGSG